MSILADVNPIRSKIFSVFSITRITSISITVLPLWSWIVSLESLKYSATWMRLSHSFGVLANIDALTWSGRDICHAIAQPPLLSYAIKLASPSLTQNMALSTWLIPNITGQLHWRPWGLDSCPRKMTRVSAMCHVFIMAGGAFSPTSDVLPPIVIFPPTLFCTFQTRLSFNITISPRAVDGP